MEKEANEVEELKEEKLEKMMEEVIMELSDDVAKEVVLEEEAKEVEDMDGGWEEE